ncbi:hypothetical protein CU097_007605 [Rhizopus azygosporus]|uniref:F-box domain-containing protein n=1 Tax=Rhizopus azygosporus TaxID=86630 RepID=A0A367K8V5_RHIAZ|nr:hypothetical protein CU097_007605 [Rhizopus azygosporus]
MSRWKELPNEILCEIFEQLKSNSGLYELIECQLVCKNWRKHASSTLYRELGFDGCLQGEKFTKCMQNSCLGSLVREITIWCYSKDETERLISLIYKLAETCPNVEVFDGALRHSHWDALRGAVGSYWKQLKRLPEPHWSMRSDEDTFSNYYTLAYVCRRTLTHIVLPPTSPFSSQFTRVLPLLPFFIGLTHLTVAPNIRMPTLMEFDEAIQQCPNLTCFTVHLSPGAPIEAIAGDTNRYDVFSIQPHFKLKKLEVKICLHQDTFDYIMHTFPNLECCNVHLFFNEDLLNRIGSWMTRHYEEKLRAFQKYLSSRKCDWFWTFGSFPVIEYLQRTTNPVVRIYASFFPSLRIQQDNITWTMDNTRENTDRLQGLFKKCHVIKEAYMKASGNHDIDHPILALLSECKGLEKLTFETTSRGISLIKSRVSNQILSSSLITLKLIVTEIRPEALTAFSYAYPELRNLVIESCYFGNMSPMFEIDMPKTNFNHLQIHLVVGLFIHGGCESEVKKPVILEITSQKSRSKRFLTNFVAPNHIEEFTTNKEYEYMFVINCAGIDYLSLSINKMHMLKKYPLLL